MFALLASLAFADVPTADELGKGQTPTEWALPWHNGDAPRHRRHPDPPYPKLAAELGLDEVACSFRVAIAPSGAAEAVEFFECLPVVQREVRETVLKKWYFHPAISASRQAVLGWMDVDLQLSSGKVYGAVRAPEIEKWLDGLGRLEGPDTHCRVEIQLTTTRGRFSVATNNVPECLVLTQKRTAWGEIPGSGTCTVRFSVGGWSPGGMDWGDCSPEARKHIARTFKRWQWHKPRDRDNLYEVTVTYAQ
jgi:hypothetical protein